MAAVPALLIIVIVFAGYFWNRDQLFAVAVSLKNKKLFTEQSSLPTRHDRRLLSLSGDDRLDGGQLKKSVDDLVGYAKKIKPTWIVGVHPGGRLLSTFVGDQIGLPSYRCLYIRTNRHREVVFVPPINAPLEGTVLIIDDISRTGKTFNSIKYELIEKNYSEKFRLTKVYVAVIAVEFKQEAEDTFRPDFAVYRTEVEHLKFPWSEFSARIGVAITRKNDGLTFDESVMSEYVRLIEDYEFARELGKQYLEESSETVS